MLESNINLIKKELNNLYPNPKCALNYTNLYELLIAVVLSAQTTDEKVNTITPILFSKYPTVEDLSKGDYDVIEEIIHPLGLSRNKAKSLLSLANTIMNDFNGEIPTTLDDLIKLSGVGRKVANVILVEGLHVSAFPVDTHVDRVTKRFGFIDDDKSVLDVEKFWVSNLEPEYFHKMHHQLIYFGRNICHARNPKCDICFYKDKCKFYNN